MITYLRQREIPWLEKNGGGHPDAHDLPMLMTGGTILLKHGSKLAWSDGDKRFVVTGYTESRFLADVAPLADAREHYLTH